MPPETSSGLLEQIAFFFAACATWIAGEAGRAFLAGVSGACTTLNPDTAGQGREKFSSESWCTFVRKLARRNI